MTIGGGGFDGFIPTDDPTYQQMVDHLVASKSAPSTFNRPVWEYPKFPRYTGSGNPSDADNFTCSAT